MTLKVEVNLQVVEHYLDKYRQSVIEMKMDRLSHDVLLERTRKMHRGLGTLISYLDLTGRSLKMNRRDLERPCPEQWTHPDTGESITQFCKRFVKQHKPVKDDASYLIAVGEQMSFDFDEDEGE